MLDHTKLGEQDLILTLLASNGSQLRAVAKGGRKPGSKLSGRCELFCEVDLLVAAGRSLDVVAEASLLDAHAGLRGDLDRVSAASAICDVARCTCYEDSPDPFLAPIASRALRACEEAPDRTHLDLAVAAYAFKVLAHEGWRPVLSSCVDCGDENPTRFSARAGGVLCESCSQDVEGAEPVSPGQVAWLQALLDSTFDQLMACSCDEVTAGWLVHEAHIWCVTQLDVRLRALEFLLSV